MSLIENKKAHFNYEIVEKYEAGVELLGTEVKSLRNKQGSLDSAHVSIRGNEAYLLNSFIPPYQPVNAPSGYDPHRARRLLLTKKEIDELIGKERTKGLTLVAISMYNKTKHIKLSFGLGRIKKKYDKREVIKKKDSKRDIDRVIKGSR